MKTTTYIKQSKSCDGSDSEGVGVRFWRGVTKGALGRIIAGMLVLGAACAVLGGLSGCNSKEEKGSEEMKPEEMLSLYQSKIPVGTTVTVARSLMQQDGFDVSNMENRTWKGRKGLTFLRCVRDDGKMIKRRWEFAVMHNGLTVTAIELRPGLVYP